MATPRTHPTSPERGPRTRRVAMVVYPDFQLLDATGPLEVFATANRLLSGRSGRPAAYERILLATEAGPVTSHSGVTLMADASFRRVRAPLDTLIVAGGFGVAEARREPSLQRFLQREAGKARRVASVCSGAFALAEAGLLDGRRAVSHWSTCDELARSYPKLQVESDPIYLQDGKYWTSAGVTAGMDLALALVEEDHGRELALSVAQWLVLFLKRPGGQSQFSAQLSSQLAEREPLREIQGYVAEHPAADLSVPALADRIGMSPRNFARVFAREVGTTPARFVERSRVEAARRRLEDSEEGIDAIAAECGFGCAETMRRAFLRSVRVPPTDYRGRFRAPGAGRGQTRATTKPRRGKARS